MKIKILATSDIHGYVMNYRYSDNKITNIGLARLAALINKIKDENTVIIDNGDTIQGSPLTYYHHLYHENEINPLALCLNKIGYDYINLGNHDFNYGRDVLARYLKNLDAKCITCNINDDKNEFNFSYDIKDFGHTKLAFIGLTNNFIENWEIKSNIEGLTFYNAFDKLKELVNLLRNKVDYIIGVYHGGFEKDLITGIDQSNGTTENLGYKMCQEIKGLDVLISGHQHRSIATKLFDTVVTQTAQNGQELAAIVIDVEQKTIKAELLSTDEVDNDCIALINERERQCQKWLDQNIGRLDQDNCKVNDGFEARLHNHNIIQLMNQIQKDYTNADVSAVALFNDAVGFNQDITMRDIVSTYVYPNTLVKVEINGKILKRYLEQAARYFTVIDGKISINKDFIEPKPMHFDYDLVSGIDYVIDPSKDFGCRVFDIYYHGHLLQDDEILTIVVNNYRISGGGNYWMLKEGKVLQDDGKEMVEILAEYLIAHKDVKIIPDGKIEVKITKD